MASQSLYRRYRPRRFGEMRGQDHVVRALRNAVEHDRAGQGYLFSGPRGTGKTTSARILAKVLNCTDPKGGEPCCACASCLAVEAGNSYDVFELDAASNNGVESMRDLIEKASLGTPGRHKVYILDEVHMLSKGAEAALLKTLEEPPPHVVFVLATTDPQKVSQTIRSRVQHLEFHLLPMDELEAHVRWVAEDAGLAVSEEGIHAALAQGGGSARDTLSALELVAASGGDAPETLSYDEFIEALVNRDPGQALAALAHSVQQGRDPRVLAQEIIRHLRDCFLSIMAPELVQLPDARAAAVSEQAQRLGAAMIVRSMERLGEILVEMRHAPDPRLLLDIAFVQLTHDATANDVSGLLVRIERLEKQLAAGGAAAPSAPAARPAPTDPSTGRAAIGGRARRADGAPVATVPPAASSERAAGAAAPAPGTAQPVVPAASSGPVDAAAASGPAASPSAPTVAAPPDRTPTAAPAAGELRDAFVRVTSVWQGQVLPSLKPMARALFSAGHFVGERDGALEYGLPNDAHRQRCQDFLKDVEAAVRAAVGAPVTLRLVVAKGAAPDDLAPVVPLRGGAVPAAPPPPPPDDDVDLDDLVDAPPGSVKTPEDRLAEAFPGSVFIDEPR